MTRDQQKRLNAMCGDLSAQVEWSVRVAGVDYPTKLHRDDWRHMFAGIQLGSRISPNPMEPGRFVTLAASSKLLSVEDASHVMEMIAAFGAEWDVVWSDPELESLADIYDKRDAAERAE